MTENEQLAALVQHAAEQNPSKFQEVFADAMQDKIASAIQAKKIEVAQNYFNADQEAEAETEAVETESEEE